MTNQDYLLAVPDGLITRPSGSWAAEKLDYISRYIDIFETSMRSKWPERNYIDLFAGPGKNIIKKTGNMLLGSPILALITRHPFTSYYFTELKKLIRKHSIFVIQLLLFSIVSISILRMPTK
jgi:hypothetical protein